MVEKDLGEATIVYEDPDEDTVERTVPNEHVAYLQDHWIIKTDEDEHGRDRIRRIPAQRVHYVERTVEEFEQEVSTVVDRIESVATSLQTKLPIGAEESTERRREPYQIHIDDEETQTTKSGSRDS